MKNRFQALQQKILANVFVLWQVCVVLLYHAEKILAKTWLNLHFLDLTGCDTTLKSKGVIPALN